MLEPVLWMLIDRIFRGNKETVLLRRFLLDKDSGLIFLDGHEFAVLHFDGNRISSGEGNLRPGGLLHEGLA